MNSEKYRTLIEEQLTRIVESEQIAPCVAKVMRYSLFPGGKRIRPAFLLSAIEDLGGDVSSAAPIAAAVELLHCASLVHDDLPAIDNDDMRRGKPSVHKEFSEAEAILVGDLMVPAAFAAVLNGRYRSADVSSAVAAVLSEAYRDVCNGQAMDIQPQLGNPGYDLASVYRCKTGALFGALFECSAILLGSDEKRRTHLRNLGEEVGFVFQLLDDLLDRSSEKGRAEGSDRRNRKMTLLGELAGSMDIDQYLERQCQQLESRLIEIEELFNKRLSEVRALLTSIVGPVRRHRKEASDTAERRLQSLEVK